MAGDYGALILVVLVGFYVHVCVCACVCVFTCIFDDSSRHILPANSSLQVNKHKHTSALCSVISTVLSFALLPCSSANRPRSKQHQG